MHDHSLYGRTDTSGDRLARTTPTVIWGALMVAALAGAGVVAWRGGAGAATKVVAAEPTAVERFSQDLQRLAADRDELAQRLARVERGVGELKIAMRVGGAGDVTGSINRAEPAGPVGIVLGDEGSIEALRRRWATLALKHPRLLSGLAPRTARNEARSGAFTLIAGPFPGQAEAARACAELAGDGVACDTKGYSGDPLPRP